MEDEDVLDVLGSPIHLAKYCVSTWAVIIHLETFDGHDCDDSCVVIEFQNNWRITGHQGVVRRME